MNNFEKLHYMLFYKHRLTKFVNTTGLSDSEKESIKSEISRVEIYIESLEI